MRQIKTGLIGCGKVGHIHAAALQSLPESDFVAVCARTPEKANAFAEKYHAAAFTDVDEMIAKSGVEAVCVCTPHPQHAAPTIAAAKAGVHVLVEKPLASSLTDCDAMLAAAREGKVILGTISQRRFYASCARIHQAIQAGKLGKPILG
ncbi:MAG TPA: Gfo/Idh/MocA family oxidoreductase, partial [Candidatus Acidoferrales bacterium]|nr:Gfo/Idh/MocA family oxidoreductase [Candidatus Acidoferrales bacterium]